MTDAGPSGESATPAPAGGPAAEAKWLLRTRLVEARRALSPDQRAEARRAVAGHVLARCAADGASGRAWTDVFAYEAWPSEPGSPELLVALADRGCAVYVPRTRDDHDLDWVRWPDSPRHGPEVVTRASVLLVPALAVDGQGHRIGRGRGSYDRALARLGPAAVVVALLHRGELLEHVPTEPWDRPVPAAVTPEGWIDLRSARGDRPLDRAD